MKKITLLLFLIFCLLSTCSDLSAQTAQSVINSANELIQNGRLEDAQVLLERFHRAFPKDYKIHIMYADVSYQNKKYETFMDLYDEALALHPTNYNLKLDYARMLFDINEYDKCLPLFEQYLTRDPSNIEALLAKAKIFKSYEDYNEAYSAASRVLSKDPTHAEARELHTEMQIAKSKWAKLTASYTNDSQPIEYFSPILEGGLYNSPLSSFKATISPVMYQRRRGDNINVYKVQFENRSFIRQFGLGINYGIGIMKYPASQFEFSGKVIFDKYAERYILVTLGAERQPYFGSAFSLDTNIMVNTASSSLTLITKESWNGKVTFQADFFDGIDNPISSLNSYILLPRLKIKDFDFKLGYGLNLSTSKLEKFVPDKTDAEILAGPFFVPEYSGIYYPYYTPKNQFTNSVITFIGYNPSKETEVGLSVKYAFIGTAERPYVYKDTHHLLGGEFISKNYQKSDYNPLDISFFLTSLITPKITANIGFNYSKNFFFISRSIALGVKVNFW